MIRIHAPFKILTKLPDEGLCSQNYFIKEGWKVLSPMPVSTPKQAIRSSDIPISVHVPPCTENHVIQAFVTRIRRVNPVVAYGQEGRALSGDTII